MRFLGTMLLILISQACDPYGFGFKNNPAYVLDKAFQSVQDLDPESFIEATGKEALCLYGNLEGLAYLKSHIILDEKKLEIEPKLIENSSNYTDNPLYVGYWSYYHERYQLDIFEKATKAELMKVVVECNYGFEGFKSESYRNLKLKKYKKKDCKIIKIIPRQFDSLPMKKECELLQVEL
jgi:hypothetical protein